jgi:hypothetical protein
MPDALRTGFMVVPAALVSWFRKKFSVSDAAPNLLSGLGPEERVWHFDSSVQKMGDSAFQFGQGFKIASADGLLADDAEPALDEIQPRAARRREVQMTVGVLAEPLRDRRMFVGSVIVTDRVQFATAIAAGN